jgi:hypothetical protein
VLQNRPQSARVPTPISIDLLEMSLMEIDLSEISPLEFASAIPTAISTASACLRTSTFGRQ